jgi:four helix bundle protein
MEITSHKDLQVWRKSIALASKVYAVAKTMPRDERYGLMSQVRRASVSIASNIAEGAARKTRAEFLQYLYIARGSLSELETQIMIAVALDLIPDQSPPLEDIAEVGRMLNGLISKLTSAARTAHASSCSVQPLTANR